jgi:hypothetical protein
MIAGSSGPYAAITARDHDLRPECLNLKLGHERIEGSYCGMAGVPRSRRTGLASRNALEWDAQSFLEFLAAGSGRGTLTVSRLWGKA